MPVTFALTLLLSVGAAGASMSGTTLDVRVSRGELTVDVHEAPLAQVLRTVGERSGVAVTLRGDFSAPITQSFTSVPLEEGIRRLARGHSVAVTYAAPGDAPGPEILTGVWVIKGSSPPPGASVAGGNTRGDTALRDRKADETLHSRPGGWIDGIHALAEEAEGGSEAAVELLTGLSATDPSAMVRHQAVSALGRLKGPEVEAALTAALADEDASVRVRAVRGLRGTGSETAMQSLTGVVTGDGDPQVRLAALRALASLPGPTTLQGLMKASSDPDGLVRETATRGLSWWTTRLRGAP